MIKKGIKGLIAFFVLAMGMVSYLPLEELVAENSDNNFTLALNTTTAVINTGEEARFSLSFGFSSLTESYGGAKLVVVFPPEMVNAVASAANMPIIYDDGSTDSLVPAISGNTITYTAAAGKKVEPGFAGVISLLKAKTSSFYTLPGTVPIKATISGTVGGVVRSLSDTLSIQMKTVPVWNLTKTAQFPTYNEDTFVRFRLYIQAPNQNANLGAKGFSVVDDLPQGVTFVAFDDPNDPNITAVLPGLVPSNSATWGSSKAQPYSSNTVAFPAGSASRNNDKVTWTVPTNTGKVYDNTSYLELTFWVKLDDSILAQPGDTKTITNTGSLSTTLLDNTILTKDAEGKLLVIDSQGDTQNVPGKDIYFANSGYGLDTGTVYFALKASSFYNKASTLDIQNYIISDTSAGWSEALKLKDIRVPVISTGVDSKPNLSYKVEFLNGAAVISTTNALSNAAKVFTAPLNSNGYRITIAEIPRGTGVSGANIQDVVVGFTLDRTKVTADKCIYNRADFTYTFNGQTATVNKQSGCQLLSDSGATRVTLGKSIDNKKSLYQYDDIVNYSIAYSNQLYSGKNVENVIFYDLLPKELKFIPGTVTGNVTVVGVEENYQGSGRQRVAFRLNGALAINTSGTIKFNAYVTEDVKTGATVNEVYMTADTRLVTDYTNLNPLLDVSDIDGDGNTTETVVRATTSFDGAAYSGILIVKEARGDLDTSWSRYPLVAKVSAGGQLQYRMTIRNLSTKPMNSINVVDIFPAVGDTGVLVTTARGSEWTPYLKAPIVPPPGVSIAYSTSSNPNRGAIGRPLIGEATTNWLTQAPSDITSVRSMKLTYANSLLPNGTFVFTYDMVTPVGVPRNGEIAWNSFGMQAKNADATLSPPPVEPKKVGVVTAAPVRAAIIGRTWIDDNRDGILGATEPGLNGTLVYLLYENGTNVLDALGNPLYTVTSNNATGLPGFYTFSNVIEGNYLVEFKPMAGYGKTLATGLGSPLDPNKSDYDLADFRTQRITVGSTDVLTIDGGFTLSKIGDFVFNDSNDNGIQDAGESGIEGLKVTLLKDGVFLSTTLTNPVGYYEFTRLISGRYEIVVEKPLLNNFSPANIGNDNQDSDVVRVTLQTAKTAPITLGVDGQGISVDDMTVDAGLSAGKASIAGSIWDDLRRDNIQGLKPTGAVAEDRIAGIPLFLYNSEGIQVATTITAADGSYLFANIAADTYVISMSQPSQYQIAAKNIGADSQIDNDFDPITRKTAPLIIGLNDQITHIDGGLYTAGLSSISGSAFLDDSYNCLKDVNEGGYSGLTIRLVDAVTGTLIATTTTDTSGAYRFSNLVAGTYQIQAVNNKPAIFSIGNPVGTFATEIVVTTNSTNIANTPPGGICLQYLKSSIGNYVWLDLNRNGMQDDSERGLAGVTLKLFKSGVQVGITTSDASGFYRFTDVEANNSNYRIEVLLPSTDYEYTIFDVIGGNLVNNSLANPRSGEPLIADMTVRPLAANTSNTTYDVGVIYKKASIGDMVFLDVDNNGYYNAEDNPLSNIRVELYQVGNPLPVKSTITDAGGKYLFDSLNPGEYYVQVVQSTVPSFIVPTIQHSTNGMTGTDSDISQLTYATDSFKLSAGEQKTDIDAGFIYKVTYIGDYLFIDVNRDGLQDQTDIPLANTLVYLYKVNPQTQQKVKVREGMTDAAGKYQFILSMPLRLENGVFYEEIYYIGFDVPPNTTLSSTVGNGSNPEKDNNFSILPEGALSTPLTMTVGKVGNDDFTIDGAVEYNFAEIGDYVWADANRNGIQDNGEYPIEGVRMLLHQFDGVKWNFFKGGVTDSDGYYLFDKLEQGLYKIEIQPLENMNLVAAYAGDSLRDSDFCPESKSNLEYFGVETLSCDLSEVNKTQEFKVAPGDKIRGLDAGLQEKYAEIGDYVWLDLNRDGIQDASEPALADIIVSLIDENNNILSETKTDAAGKYNFNRLDAGKYSIEIDLTPKYLFTLPNSGGIGQDSDIVAAMSKTEWFNLGKGESNNTVDAGLVYVPSSIGNYVWLDSNRDGIQDITEAPAPGVTVTLLEKNNDDWSQKASLETDVNGFYEFTNLNPGVYKVEITLPQNMNLSPYMQNPGATDSDFCPEAASEFDYEAITSPECNLALPKQTAELTLGINEQITDIDAGLQPKYLAIGDYIWLDYNRNNVQDIDEVGLENISLSLLDENDNIIDTTATDVNGKYQFTKLEAGKYTVQLENIPAIYMLATKNIGTSDQDSDFEGTTNKSEIITLMVGEQNQTIDGGLQYRLSSIGDKIWFDTNENGLQDVGEDGIGGLTVSLWDKNKAPVTDGLGNIVMPITTDAQGNYQFANLNPGDYQVELNLTPENRQFYQPTLEKNGNNQISDSNLTAGFTSEIISLVANLNEDTIDFGLINKRAAIGDSVWIDTNEDGLQDAMDTPLSGVSVELHRIENGAPVLIASTVTDGGGKYFFPNLNPLGVYRLRFVEVGNLDLTIKGAGSDLLDSDVYQDTLWTDDITLVNGQVDNDVDAGYIYPDSIIGDYVWSDLNGNGLQDALELGVEGVKVTLVNEFGEAVVDGEGKSTTMTNAQGYYSFVKLHGSRNYKVVFELPAAYSGFTQKGSTLATEALDSNVDSLGVSDVFVLQVNQKNTSIDAGLLPKNGMIGDYVWFDANENGLQDVTEVGVKGIELTLLNADRSRAVDTFGNVIPVMVTDESGFYQFSYLREGYYIVAVTLNDEQTAYYEPTKTSVGSDVNQDSDLLSSWESGVTGVGINQVVNYVDCGLINKRASIGDYAWIDANSNGLQDAGESVFSGVKVTLYRENAGQNIWLREVFTDALGQYLFAGLDPTWTYKVQFTTPTGYDVTDYKTGVNGGIDSDANTLTGMTNSITLVNGQNLTSIDVGYILPQGGIGNYVWEDRNEDGLQDVNEPAIADVLVELFDEFGNAVTDGAGNTSVRTSPLGLYQFVNLHGPRQYQLKFTLPPNYGGFTMKHAVVGQEQKDSDVFATGMTELVRINPKEINQTIDAGLIPAKGSIGNYTWIDSNKNGLQDVGEMPLSGVQVDLYVITDSVRTYLSRAVSDGSGQYLFTNLNPLSRYQLQFLTPADYDITTKWINGVDSDESDSDIDTGTGWTDEISLAYGENNSSIDAGYIYPDGILGDFVFADLNENGLQDNQEPGVENVLVELLNGAGAAILDGLGNPITTRTNNGGYYSFLRLQGPETYQLKFTLPAEYSRFTVKNSDPLQPMLDSNVDLNGVTDAFTLNVKEHNTSIDAGLIPRRASIGNYTWLDENRDGLQNNGEGGLAGVVVSLYAVENGALVFIEEKITDINGQYEFTNLFPTPTYRLLFGTPAANDITTRRVNGLGDNDIDSDIDTTTGWSEDIRLAYGQNETSIDAGYITPSGIIGNYVFADFNQNGLQDNNEPGVAGVRVELFDESGVMVVDGTGKSETLTDGSGQYSFEQLHGPKSYQVKFTLPTLYSGFSPKQAAGTTFETDSDVNSDGKTDTFTLAVKENMQTIDAGIIPRRASIGNYVWLDANQNGLQDITETGITNVRVELYTVDVLGTRTYLIDQLTDGQGAYLFENLDPTQAYALKFTTPSIYDITTKQVNGTVDSLTDSDIDETTGWSETITLIYGENNDNIDAGYIVPDTTIGNYVFADLNEDGLQDSLEPGIAGVRVELLDNFDMPVADGAGNFFVLTDAMGHYHFVNLHGPATYKVKFNLPTAYSGFSPQSANPLQSAIDSNANSNGITAGILVAAKQKDETIDAGLIPRRGSIGNYTWLDENWDGLQNNGEGGLAGVVVALYAVENGAVVYIGETTTDVNGQYEFTNLLPTRIYRLRFETPAANDITTKQVNGQADNDIDSNIDTTTGWSEDITLAYGENNTTIDAGYIAPSGIIGNYVFADFNQNGLQDSNEPGVAGVKVELLDEAGAAVIDGTGKSEMLTDATGQYSFQQLHGPKKYQVQF
ncbi:MAG: SdrD B-like domain-containing protein, partial [Culicoidibacterales bacterium]